MGRYPFHSFNQPVSRPFRPVPFVPIRYQRSILSPLDRSGTSCDRRERVEQALKQAETVSERAGTGSQGSRGPETSGNWLGSRNRLELLERTGNKMGQSHQKGLVTGWDGLQRSGTVSERAQNRAGTNGNEMKPPQDGLEQVHNGLGTNWNGETISKRLKSVKKVHPSKFQKFPKK